MSSAYPEIKNTIFHFQKNDIKKIREFINTKTFNPFMNDGEFERFITQSSLIVKLLPNKLISDFKDFARFGNDNGVFLVSGFPINDQNIGPTPTNIDNQPISKSNYESEMYLTGLSSIIGEIFAFKSQYGSQLIQNIVPIKEHALEQRGSGSQIFLDWHVEDAAFEFRADVIALLCIRSDPNAATTVAAINNMNLPDHYKKSLFEKKFLISIDPVHEIKQESNKLISVLFGNFENPYLRLDPLYMKAIDKESEKALDWIIGEIQNAARQVILQPGDLIFIDNYRTVHGRTKFTPKYNGTDRWLQRVSITFDLRKSAHLRTKQNRVISDFE